MPAPESEMHAYYELEGALIDLRREGADPICIETIERVQRWIDPALAAAHAKGRAEGLEEAASLVNEINNGGNHKHGDTLNFVELTIRSQIKDKE